MQAVIAIPELAGLVSEQQAMEMLMRPVAGVPLLIRSVLTAARAGASDVLLVAPAAMSARLLQKLLETISRQEVRVELIQISEFDPRTSFRSFRWSTSGPSSGAKPLTRPFMR
jgi:hypothetical protein